MENKVTFQPHNLPFVPLPNCTPRDYGKHPNTDELYHELLSTFFNKNTSKNIRMVMSYNKECPIEGRWISVYVLGYKIWINEEDVRKEISKAFVESNKPPTL